MKVPFSSDDPERLTKLEVAVLRDITKPFIEQYSKKPEMGDVWNTNMFDAVDFIKKVFLDRGVKLRRFPVPEFIVFHHVGMHIDAGFYTGKRETLLIPIRGSGDLQHFKGKYIKDDSFRGCLGNVHFSRMLRLNQDRPHSYIATKTSSAIAVGILTKELDAAGIE